MRKGNLQAAKFLLENNDRRYIKPRSVNAIAKDYLIDKVHVEVVHSKDNVRRALHEIAQDMLKEVNLIPEDSTGQDTPPSDPETHA
jgi:hypothetical protein